jgi:predicted alpha/beta-fold hydrolase
MHSLPRRHRRERGQDLQAQAARFLPSRWLRNRHLQTLGASLPFWSPAQTALANERVLFPLRCGDTLVARASWQPGADPRPAVLLVHGVGGSGDSFYVQRAALALFRAGFHVVRLNLRGAGEGVTLATSIYHAGMSGDIDEVVRALGSDRRLSSLAVIGFSLGGSLVLKLAGEWGQAPPSAVRAVATLSAPTDFFAVSRELERWSTFAYRRFILAGVIRQASLFARHHPQRADYSLARLATARTIREYDEQVMMPMHRFGSVDEYYASTSAAPFLPRITVPTLIVHAEDDPIIPGHTVAPSLQGLPDAIEVLWTRRGGHVGWLAGATEEHWVETWAVRRILDFLARGDAP